MKSGLLALLLFPTTALAIDNKSYICTSGQDQRIIEIQYNGDADTPCEVVYTKDGASTTLWQATNQGGYCEQKALDFVDQQSSWGWQCNEQNAQTTIMDAEVLKSTSENLSAGQEAESAEAEPVDSDQ